MKFTVTVRVTNEFTIELSAKDEYTAIQKAQESWEKLLVISLDYQNMGKFEHDNEDIEFEAEEQ